MSTKENKQSSHQLARVITDLAKKRDISMRELSERIPVPYTYLHAIERGEIPWRMTFHHLDSISEFFEVDVFKLLNVLLAEENKDQS